MKVKLTCKLCVFVIVLQVLLLTTLVEKLTSSLVRKKQSLRNANLWHLRDVRLSHHVVSITTKPSPVCFTKLSERLIEWAQNGWLAGGWLVEGPKTQGPFLGGSLTLIENPSRRAHKSAWEK